MTFKTSILRSAAITAGIGAAFAAQANLIDPVLLQNSTDGANANVQSLLADRGFTSSVGTVAPDYGNQTNNEIFDLVQQGSVWRIIWQNADFAATHKLGYYTNIGDAVIDDSDITWVLGDLDNDRDPGDLVTDSAAINLNSFFGLAFFSSRPDGNDPHTYYSQTFRNGDPTPGAKDHAASINALPVPAGYDEAVVVTWEDSFDQIIDKDFNDFGTLITGVRPVPEPATLAALGMGAVALLRRRRAKK
jgi:hypothetical protein